MLQRQIHRNGQILKECTIDNLKENQEINGQIFLRITRVSAIKNVMECKSVLSMIIIKE